MYYQIRTGTREAADMPVIVLINGKFGLFKEVIGFCLGVWLGF